MNAITNIRKDIYGKWVAETKVALTDSRQLTLRTCKRDNGAVQTFASVAIVKNENGCRIETFEVYGDYMKCVYSEGYKRVTQKVIEEQASIARGYLSQIMEQVRAFYAAKGIEIEVAA